MSIRAVRDGAHWNGAIETPRGEFKNRYDLLSRQMKPFHDFIDRSAIFEVVEHRGNGQPRIFKNPCAAQSFWDALYGRALGPIQRCHF
jgi:hypothetical protein